jgi:hypothetical protein
VSADRLRRAYGARLLHLVGLIAVIGVSAYAVVQVAGRPDFRAMAIWFLGAVIAHDLVFLPAYSVANRLSASAGPVRRRGRGALLVLNHLRAPIALATILFILFYPSILQRSEGGFLSNAGYGTDPFPDRWVWASVAILAASLLLLAASTARRQRRSGPGAVADGASARAGQAAEGVEADTGRGGQGR